MRVVLRREAAEELEAARVWYETASAGLGIEFVSAAEAAIGHIVSAPAAFPQVHQSIRRLLMQRFPYGIFYFQDASEIVILGITHMRRDPRRWQARR